LKFGIKAGANLTQLYFTEPSIFYSGEQLNMKVGYLGGVELVGNVKAFSFGLELLLIQQSGDLTV